MTLDDENAAGTVNISIDISALTAADVMIGMYLNSDPAQGPAGMTLTHTSARASAGISSGIDCCKPDGHGDHDVQIEFPRAAAGRFTGDEAYTGMLMLDAVLATDFAFLSSTGSCAIERVQGLGSSAAGRGAVGSIARMSLSRKSRSRVRWPCPVSASACSACLVAAAKTVHQQQESVALRDSGASAQDKMPPLCGGFSFMTPKASRHREPRGCVQAERKKKPPYSGVSS